MTADTLSETETQAPAARRDRPMLFLACITEDEAVLVYQSRDGARLRQIKEELRARYGDIARFHTVCFPSQDKPRWTRIAADMDAAIAAAEEEPHLVGAPDVTPHQIPDGPYTVPFDTK